jgi:hypothetical protein
VISFLRQRSNGRLVMIDECQELVNEDQSFAARWEEERRSEMVQRARSYAYGLAPEQQDQLACWRSSDKYPTPDVMNLIRREAECARMSGRYDGDYIWTTQVEKWLMSCFAEEACVERMERAMASAQGATKHPGRL